MATDIKLSPGELSCFTDSEPFWVIWQVSRQARGNRIRRISQDYPTAARAEADAAQYRRSGVVTWVEEARRLAPANVPAEAVEALRAGAGPAAEVVRSIGSAAA
ncbi:MAG TPA: hypothetical protein VGW34_06085 [Allosphingosinicella sp.]|nr:hypothetical protein [Allosphingosinicella sp.]